MSWAPVSMHGNCNVISRLEGILGVTKLIKRVKDYSYREKLEKLGLTNLQERRVETFKIIDGISNYGWRFSIFLFKLEIYCQDKFQKLSLLNN